MQSKPLCRKKRQGTKKNPCHSKTKKKSKKVKRQEILSINLLDQELLVPFTLKEFTIGLYEKVTVNMILCSELKEEEDKRSHRQNESPKVANRTLFILEALPARIRMGENLLFA